MFRGWFEQLREEAKREDDKLAEDLFEQEDEINMFEEEEEE